MDRNNLYKNHLKRLSSKIQKDQNSYFKNLQEELISKPSPGQTFEEKEANKQRILNYVHKYVFLQKLTPIVPMPHSKVIARMKEGSKVKHLLVLLLLIRDVFGTLFRIKAILIIVSALVFFSFEYWVHYYTFISLKDINITYKTIIERIPPFF